MSHLQNMGEVVIRRYKKSDRSDIRRICCDTAFMGEPMEPFLSDRGVLADFVTSYYTDYEAGSTFVAELDGRVVGYLTGGINMSKKLRTFIGKVLPGILLRSISKGFLFDRKTRDFLLSCIKSALKREFSHPNFLKDYPGHLHINVDKDFRRMGIGSKLIGRYLDYLKSKMIRGVHLTTTSENLGARSFFEKMGFELIFSHKTSLWRYILRKDVEVLTFARKII